MDIKTLPELIACVRQAVDDMPSRVGEAVLMVCDAVENTMKKEVPTQGPPPFETGDVVRVRGIPTAPLMSVSSCQLHSQHGWLVPVCWFVEDHEATSTFLAGQLEKVR